MGTFAASYKPTNNGASIFPLSTGGPQAIDAVSTVQNYPLGTVIKATDAVLGECEFVYCSGVASTVVGDPIQINADFTTVRAVGGTAVGHIGVAMAAVDAATKWGWYCIKGRVPVKIAANVAAAARASIVSAVWSDANTATKQIVGASLAIGLDAGGSAIVGTTDTTAQHFTIATLVYPQAANYV